MMGSALFILLIWLVVSLVLLGLGCLFLSVLKIRLSSMEDCSIFFWTGWALLLTFLQVWHIFFPIRSITLILLCLAGCIGLYRNGIDFRVLLGNCRSHPFYVLGFFTFVFAIACHAMTGPVNYDTGLYHWQTIKWINSYPIIPGLGNIHGRLAFNQSYFLFVALFDFGEGYPRSYYFAGGLLLLGLVLEYVLVFRRMLLNQPLRISDTFLLLMLLPVSFIFRGDISGPSPDIPVAILQLLVEMQLLRYLEYKTRGVASNGDEEQMFVSLMLLCAVGITIKLSFLGFGLTAVGIATLIRGTMKAWNGFFGDKTIAMVTLALLTTWGAWVLRGIVLSGYPLYPSPVSPFPVDWRIPIASAVNEMNWVLSWARMPGIHWRYVLENWDWLWPWIVRSRLSWEMWLPLLLAIPSAFCVFRSRGRGDGVLGLLAMLPPFVGLVYWFSAAPHPRFLGTLHWALASVGFASLCHKGAPRWRLSALRAYSLSVVLITFIGIAVPVTGKSAFFITLISERSMRKALLHLSPKNYFDADIHEVEHAEYTTGAGLKLYYPKHGDQCWDIPLPCTPYPNEALHLRDATDMSKGFRVFPFHDSKSDIGMHP